MNIAAIVISFAAAFHFALGQVLTQFGLRHVSPLSGAAISIPTFTLVFLCASPFILRGETIVWSAVPIFAAVGLAFPAVVTLLTFASNRALGPVVTSSLGNLSPLFAVSLAVVLLHEPLRPLQFAGLVIVVAGVLLISAQRQGARDWRTWALLLPLGAAALRGLVPPVIKLGLDLWPSPIAAGLVGYIFSSLTVIAVEKIRNGRFIAKGPRVGRLWFMGIGICNGIATMLLYAALGAGPVSLVVPLIATFPLFTVVLSVIAFGKLENGLRLAGGTVLTVAGVVLILIG
ncbi:MAG: DMT family transporter [Pseudomonadota bacterium]